jgi:hypothetical protein
MIVRGAILILTIIDLILDSYEAVTKFFTKLNSKKVINSMPIVEQHNPSYSVR